MTQWYEELFKNYSEKYDREPFTFGTGGEVDFIEHEIKSDKSLRILDIGCGTGRHSIELARRGYAVKGIDLSESMLSRAKEKAAAGGVRVEFIRADARYLKYEEEFGLALIICEGAFPLMETDEMNFLILQNAFNALAPGGTLILTTLNGLFPLFHSVKDFINDGSSGGTSGGNSFDLMTFRDFSTYETADDAGRKMKLSCSERYYVPPEITWLLKQAGFRRSDIFGCETGVWSRDRALTHEHFEMLVVAVK
jgi:SAM-dependent methyltransferase